MANWHQRYKDNVLGEFFVDQDCIYCGLCSKLAPNNFRLSEDGDHDIVYKQPENSGELKACLKVMDACPVEAIGRVTLTYAQSVSNSGES